MSTTLARITSTAHHDSGVRLVTLTLSDEFPFHAGQYLNVVHRSGARIPMSIASAPERLPQLELHFRGMPGVPEAQLMAEILDGAPDVHIEGPHGAVCVDGPIDEDLLLIAGGSGIAQCRAIVTHLRHAGQTRDITLIWSVTAASQLYCDDEMRSFAPWLHYTALVDVPNSENAAVVWLRKSPPTRGRVIVSGSPGFVYAVSGVLAQIGATSASIESDVFSYAPRR